MKKNCIENNRHIGNFFRIIKKELPRSTIIEHVHTNLAHVQQQ